MNRSHVPVTALAVLALTACAGGGKSTPPPPPPSPVIVTTFQAGGTLLGQPDWTTAPPGVNPCTSASLDFPYGGVGWDGTRLVVADSFSGRLLGFAPLPGVENDPATAPAASFVVGEPDAATCNDPTSTLFVPQAPSVAGAKLVVADSGFQQVFVWDAVPATQWDAAPSAVFGDATVDCAGTGLLDPRGAIVVGAKVVIADSGHNRVLVYDLADATHPLLVLGQQRSASADPFDRCAYNDTDGDGADGGAAGSLAPDAATMRYPTAVWSDGTRLVVADTDNHRLLVWNAFPTTSGKAADVVVGQSTFTASAPGAGAAGLNSPQSVASDGEQLFVADTGNHRVLVYPSVPTASGADATIVLGQGDFAAAHVAANDANQDGVDDGAPSAQTLSGPTGVAVVDGMLAVTDTGNGRVVIYRTAP